MVLMPGITPNDWRNRFMIGNTGPRAFLSFSFMNRKPLLVAPPKPTAEVTLSTAGSARTISLTAT